MAHAVVIGASIAGLGAAKALADRFDRVTVLERDSLPTRAVPRRGVPQGNHAHILLAAGQRALVELFPGIDKDMIDAGAFEVDPGVDMAFHRFGGLWPKVSVGLTILSFSRPLLDTVMLRRLSDLSNVEVRSGVFVGGLLGSGGRVTGVTVDDDSIEAELVVDASGRGNRSDRWLAELGFPAPEAVEVKIGVGYATRLFKRAPGSLTEGKGIYVLPTSPDKRAGLLLAVEEDRWLLSIGGWHGDFPRDDASLAEYAASLPHPGLHDVLASADPVSPLHVHTFPSSKRRHFEKLDRVPDGFLATGDAVCSFNPIYGQGMTVAAFNALAMRDTIEPREYYRRVAANLEVPWRFAVGGDFAFPETTGPKPRGIGLLNGYMRRLQSASRNDPVVRRAFTSVQHMVEPPSILFRPSMVRRVLRAGRANS